MTIEEWISDHETDRRARRQEAERQYQAWLANFKATDPLYLAHLKLVEDPALSPDSRMSVGRTYDGWCAGFTLDERRYCRRIVTHRGENGPTVDLEWAVDTGPIKLVLYRDGKSDGHKFFEHSVAGMEQAFARARAHAR